MDVDTRSRPTPRRAGQVMVRTVAPLFVAAVGIVGLMWILGSSLVRDSVPSFVSRTDMQTTTMADTVVALSVTAAAVVILRVWLGRWLESLVLVVAIVGELLIFLVITATVHRARPAVPQLDQAPPTSSFPSGHTGAAVALYGCLAVILLANAKPRWVAVSLALLGFAIPIVVAASRVYRGMHYLTDVLAGALASAIWLTVVLVVLQDGGHGLKQAGRRNET